VPRTKGHALAGGDHLAERRDRASSSTAAGAVIPDAGAALSLEDELRRAEKDFEKGDYIELTLKQLDRCVATGESPWPDASRG
jgi:hypothetical protein